MITLDNISAYVNDEPITMPISISVLPGAVLCINGKNGVGKSTLLKTIAGLRNYRAGAITVNNFSILEHYEEYRTKICYIGNELGLDQTLSVIENIMFWARIYGSELLLKAAIHTMRLEAHLEKNVYELSSGLQRRVQYTRLLLKIADIWLLDEPFTHMDNDGIETICNLILARAKNMGTIIMASHSVPKSLDAYTCSHELLPS